MTLGLGISPGLLELAVTVSTWLSPPPALIPLRFTVCKLASSRIAAGLLIAASVGASFTLVTVTVNVFVTATTPPLAVPPSSVTITVIVAVPLALATGV